MNRPTTSTRAISLVNTVARHCLSITNFLVAILSNVVWPKLELLIRFWLAKVFFMSGVMKIAEGSNLIDVLHSQYSAPLFSHASGAYLGGAIETIAAVLIIIGLLTRYASFALLALTLLSPHFGVEGDRQLLSAVLLAWLTINGAGPISLDSLFRRGLASSALPGAGRLLAWSSQLRIRGTPWYLILLRVWIALALLAVSLPSAYNVQLAAYLSAWLPLRTAEILPRATALVAGALLIAGLGTRYVAAGLILLLSVDAMMDVKMTNGVYLLMISLFSSSSVAGSFQLTDCSVAFSKMLIQKRQARDPHALKGLPRVVIVGAGFGGMSCATRLHGVRASITLIDRENYHLFQAVALSSRHGRTLTRRYRSPSKEGLSRLVRDSCVTRGSHQRGHA